MTQFWNLFLKQSSQYKKDKFKQFLLNPIKNTNSTAAHVAPGDEISHVAAERFEWRVRFGGPDRWYLAHQHAVEDFLQFQWHHNLALYSANHGKHRHDPAPWLCSTRIQNRDVEASKSVWPRGQIIRPRPRSIWEQLKTKIGLKSSSWVVL